MPDFTELEDASEAAAAALLATRWGHRTPPLMSTPHRDHGYESECGVCRGDVEDIAAVAVDAAYRHIAAQVLRQAGDDLLTAHPDLAQVLYQRATEHEDEIADQRRIDAAYAQTTTRAGAAEGAAPATAPTGDER